MEMNPLYADRREDDSPLTEPETSPAGAYPEQPFEENLHEAEGSTTADAQRAARPTSDAFKDVVKQFETLGQAVGTALQNRGNVVMVRINDEALKVLDMLVEAEVVKSRSQAAAYLINAGIENNQALFDKIRETTEKIAALRSELRRATRFPPEE
jgi:hypothetical protein